MGTRLRLAVILALASVFGASAQAEVETVKLSSTAFAAGASIPPRYTCDGADVSPPLAWGDPPAGTLSFALVVDDPDAPDPKTPRMRWVHWVVYDLPPGARSLPEAMRSAADLPAGARMGGNDWKKAAWGGPCPPVGRHRYFFTLYALDVVLGERGALAKRELEAAIQGHVLAEAELLGTYERGR
jgi:hypothetical protein